MAHFQLRPPDGGLAMTRLHDKRASPSYFGTFDTTPWLLAPEPLDTFRPPSTSPMNRRLLG